jgi:hypothetical protein
MAREKAAGRTRVFKRKTSAGIDKEPVQVKDTL